MRPTPAARRVEPATVCFAVVEVVALAVWLAVGRFQWFQWDDWDFLAARKAGDLGDLFRPHNEHWTTLPMLAYRGLYSVFGLRAFLPYRLLVVLVHLIAVALLFVVMRRAGVRPWIATAAASAMALFGAGAQDIILPVEVCFTGALMFGLVQLLLADHDGPLDGRDWFGLGAGLLALMCSAIGVSMVVVVGIAVLVRRGWRAAAFHTGPLAAAYLVWFLAVGHVGYVNGAPSLHHTIAFVFAGLMAAPRGITRNPGAIVRSPAFLVVVLVPFVIGSAWAVSRRRRTGRAAELAVPGALLAGAIVLLAVTGAGRSGFGIEFARAPRYVYLVAALMLPALALAADAFVDRWRWLLPVVVALFLVGIPANLRTAFHSEDSLKAFYKETRRMVLALPHNPAARDAPRSLRPEPVHSMYLTIGWLRDAAAAGRLPAPGVSSAQDTADDTFRLSFGQRRGRAPTRRCEIVRGPRTIAVRAGETIGLYDNMLLVSPAGSSTPRDIRLLFFPDDGARVSVLHTPGEILLRPAPHEIDWRAMRDDTGRPPRVCVS